MKTKNYMTLEFPSLPDNQRFACSTVAAFLSQLSPMLEEQHTIYMAVNAAVHNCIVRAYPEDAGTIKLSCCVSSADIVEVTIMDNGRLPENLEQILKSQETDNCMAMDFKIMQRFMDDVDVKYSRGVGTTIRMHKQLSVHKH